MTRSTAGVGPLGRCDWLELLAADSQYYGPVFSVAAALVSTGEHRDEKGYRTGMYGVGVEGLARVVRQRPKRVRAHLVRLVADGWLTVGRRGGGRGRATLYRPAQPALIALASADTRSEGTGNDRDTPFPGTQFESDSGYLGTENGADSRDAGTGYPEQSRDAGTGYRPASPLLGVLNVQRERSRGTQDQERAVAEAVAEQVIAHGLTPENPRELAWLIDAIEERLAEASPEDLIARFRFRYDPRRPNGFGHASTAFHTCAKHPLNSLEAATAAARARGTETPPRWQAPEADLPDEQRLDELKAAARAALRGRQAGGVS